jgi:hypothetical protein
LRGGVGPGDCEGRAGALGASGSAHPWATRAAGGRRCRPCPARGSLAPGAPLGSLAPGTPLGSLAPGALLAQGAARLQDHAAALVARRSAAGGRDLRRGVGQQVVHTMRSPCRQLGAGGRDVDEKAPQVGETFVSAVNKSSNGAVRTVEISWSKSRSRFTFAAMMCPNVNRPRPPEACCRPSTCLLGLLRVILNRHHPPRSSRAACASNRFYF